MKYEIYDKKFESKKEAQSFANEILYKNEINSTLNEEESNFMYNYFECFHLDWDTKLGVGIKRILRIKEPNYGKHRAFLIERIDGTKTDISYIINNIQKKNYNREFRQALRKCVEPQIIEFKNNVFKEKKEIICPITGQLITFENCHIDHENPTFDDLVINFISKYDIKIHPELFPKEADLQTTYDITDLSIKKEFYDFHKKNANLRAIFSNANLRRKKK